VQEGASLQKKEMGQNIDLVLELCGEKKLGKKGSPLSK